MNRRVALTPLPGATARAGIEHGAAHATEGKVFKGYAAPQVVASRGFNQTQHAHLNQFVQIEQRRDTSAQVKGHALDHRHVRDHQLLLAPSGAFVQFECGFHHVSCLDRLRWRPAAPAACAP